MVAKGNTNVVTLIIDGKNTTAIKAIDGTTTKLNELNSKSGSISGMISNAFGSMGTKIALGAAAGITALGVMIKKTVDLADDLNDMSQKTGVSVEQLSTLKYAAETSGGSLETLDTNITKLNKNIYEAVGGNKELVNVFNQLNIPVKDAAGNLQSADQVLYQIADRFQNMPDGVEKSALAIKLFGRSGDEMIPMLNQGSSGMIKMQEEARALGLEMSTASAQMADQFNDNLKKIEGSAQGLVISLVNNFAEPVSDLLTNIVGGLDVLFGRVELINGIQFKDPTMGLKQMIEFNKLLINSSEEYRGELIKNIEKQIALAEVSVMQAEMELHLWEVKNQAAKGFLDIFTDEDDAIAQHIRNGKIQIDQYKEQIELIKKYATVKTPNALLGSEDEIKKIKEQWSLTAETLQRDIIRNGLDPQSAKLQELIWKAEDLKMKYNGIANANELIDAHLESQIEKLYTIKNINPKPMTDADDNNQNVKTLLPLPDMDEIMKKFNQMVAASTEVTAGMTLEFLVMEGVISNAFGNMASAAEMAYRGFGEKNRVFFEAYKAFAIAQALADTYTSANAAYKAMVGIPFFGPVLAASAATAAIVYGLGNVGRISSLQPGSRGGGGSSATAVRMPSYNTSQVTNNNSQMDNSKNITIVIHSAGGYGSDADKEVRDKLAPAINRAIRDGVIGF